MPEYKISIITACYNNVNTIRDSIESVLQQTYPGIEYIIIDGQSTDGTIDIIRSFDNQITKFISEPDDGMYDAINKGIKLATGEIVGILNSDDFFFDKNVINDVVESFRDPETDAVYGDAIFVKPSNTDKVIRYYSSKNFSPNKFSFGYMPAHTSFYAKKALFEKLGYYKTDYQISADFELLVRFLYVNRIQYKYIEKPLVIMRTGGISNRNILSRVTLNNEIIRACGENNIRTNYLYIYLKYFTKIFEFFHKDGQ